MGKKIIILLFIAIGFTQLNAQTKFNQKLADSLGADEYGMKMYVFVILKTGENKITDKHITDSLFRGHMANIKRLADAGKLVIAGPMGENEKQVEGIFILNVKTLDEASVILDTDPAIKSKLLAVEMYPWFGSAALPMYLKHHDEVQKKSF